MPRGNDGIAAAIARLNNEYLIPLHEMRVELTIDGTTMKPSAVALSRWGRSGKKGVYLDILFCRRRQCWVTSREALVRFLREVNALPKPAPAA